MVSCRYFYKMVARLEIEIKNLGDEFRSGENLVNGGNKADANALSEGVRRARDLRQSGIDRLRLGRHVRHQLMVTLVARRVIRIVDQLQRVERFPWIPFLVVELFRLRTDF